MNSRPFFLRGYGARLWVDSIPSPADDCSKCRGGKYPCDTPAACGLAEPEPSRLPLFADTPGLSKAIGFALVLGLLAAIAAATGLMS